MAMDDDLGVNGDITYSIVQISPSGSAFMINPATGDLTVTAPVTIGTSYMLQVTATVKI